MGSGSANASSTHGGGANPAPTGFKPIYLLLLAFVPACFAFNPVAGRALVDAFGPATLTLVRWSVSGLVIGTVALMRPGALEMQRQSSNVSAVFVLIHVQAALATSMVSSKPLSV